jgi:putative phosphoribosyl transferase
MRTGAVNHAAQHFFEVPRGDVRCADRHDAGRQLAAALKRFREQHPVVVAIPRGGVPAAGEIVRALDAPLDVIIVRKIGAPWQPEYAIGAVAGGGVLALARREPSMLGIGPSELNGLVTRAEAELAERSERYRGTRAPVDVNDRTVLLVDGGLATGRTARAAECNARTRTRARCARRSGRRLTVGQRDGLQRGRGDRAADPPRPARGRLLVPRLPPDRQRRGHIATDKEHPHEPNT